MKATSPMRTVLIVDDSATSRLALRRAIERRGSSLSVVGEAATSQRALVLTKRLKPDLVTMDIHLGDDDGVELTHAIMSTSPTRVVAVTAADTKDQHLLFRSVEAGVLEVLPKLPAEAHPGYEAKRAQLVRVLRALADVPVVTRRNARRRQAPRARSLAIPAQQRLRRASLVALGASTGGPPLLHTLFAKLPTLQVPAIVVQHIQPGFGERFAEWLASVTSQEVVYCTERQRMRAGVVYIAPDHAHLVLSSFDTLEPLDAPPRRFQRPSIDELFESIAKLRPAGTLALLLTGMGRDGAEGLGLLRAQGAHTIAQLPSSCVVDSMPTAAIQAGATLETLGPHALIDRIGEMAAPAPTKNAS